MSGEGRLRLVFDTTCLNHFALADRLDVLGGLLAGDQSYLPQVVEEEIRQGRDAHPELEQVLRLEWLERVRLDTVDRVTRFEVWSTRVGAGERDRGEASALVVAEEMQAIALIDDKDATRVGRACAVAVHGTIWLLARACREGKLTPVAAGNIVDALAATGMRLPCTGAEFPVFARSHKLL